MQMQIVFQVGSIVFESEGRGGGQKRDFGNRENRNPLGGTNKT